MHFREMISTRPHLEVDEVLMRCIEEYHACAQICTICETACPGEPDVGDLTQCMRRNLGGADVFFGAGAMTARRTGSNVEVLSATATACLEACRICVEDCRKHAQMHEHCRISADFDIRRNACQLTMQQVR